MCGLGFVYPMPSAEILKTLYSATDYFIGCNDKLGYIFYEPPVGWFCELLLQMLRYGAKSPLLDIGSATGIFLLLAQQKGLDGFGVEPSSWAAEQAKEKGVKTMIGFFEEIAPTFANDSLGSIAMSHVIEHFSNPKLVLQECFRILQPGGVLGILTPNYASLRWRIPKEAFSESREHLFYFTPKSIRLLVEQIGFKICRLVTLPSPTPKAWLWSQYFQGQPVYFRRLISKWITWIYKGVLKSALNPDRWSDMILVAAKM